MDPGYVYILYNPSMPDLIKIGKTFRPPIERAKEISGATGVPEPFVIAFEIFSEQHQLLEQTVHQRLAKYRKNPRREFFHYPLKDAIALLLQLNPPGTTPESIYAAEDITSQLRKKYPDYLRHDIVAIRIVQPEGRVWLEMFQDKLMDDGRLRDQVITRTDLGFISSGVDAGGNASPMFSPSDSITKNAIKFVRDLDPFSIIMTTDLFHDDACHKIDKEHNPVYREPE